MTSGVIKRLIFDPWDFLPPEGPEELGILSPTTAQGLKILAFTSNIEVIHYGKDSFQG